MTVAPPPFRDLTGLLEARSVAVIGASDREGNIGGTAIRHMLKFGYTGEIWPVHPSAATVAGLPAPVYRWLRVGEWVLTALFTVEYVLRLYTVRHPVRYALSFFGVVDLLAILPTYLSLVVPGAQYLLVVRALRLRGFPAGVSQTAGTFVCNHVFYGLMQHAQGRELKGGFIHVPFLPQQVADRTDAAPSMALNDIIDGLRIAVEVAVGVETDVAETGGATH